MENFHSLQTIEDFLNSNEIDLFSLINNTLTNYEESFNLLKKIIIIADIQIENENLTDRHMKYIIILYNNLKKYESFPRDEIDKKLKHIVWWFDILFVINTIPLDEDGYTIIDLFYNFSNDIEEMNSCLSSYDKLGEYISKKLDSIKDAPNQKEEVYHILKILSSKRANVKVEIKKQFIEFFFSLEITFDMKEFEENGINIFRLMKNDFDECVKCCLDEFTTFLLPFAKEEVKYFDLFLEIISLDSFERTFDRLWLILEQNKSNNNYMERFKKYINMLCIKGNAKSIISFVYSEYIQTNYLGGNKMYAEGCKDIINFILNTLMTEDDFFNLIKVDSSNFEGQEKDNPIKYFCKLYNDLLQQDGKVIEKKEIINNHFKDYINEKKKKNLDDLLQEIKSSYLEYLNNERTLKKYEKEQRYRKVISELTKLTKEKFNCPIEDITNSLTNELQKLFKDDSLYINVNRSEVKYLEKSFSSLQIKSDYELIIHLFNVIYSITKIDNLCTCCLSFYISIIIKMIACDVEFTKQNINILMSYCTFDNHKVVHYNFEKIVSLVKTGKNQKQYLLLAKVFREHTSLWTIELEDLITELEKYEMLNKPEETISEVQESEI